METCARLRYTDYTDYLALGIFSLIKTLKIMLFPDKIHSHVIIQVNGPLLWEEGRWPLRCHVMSELIPTDLKAAPSSPVKILVQDSASLETQHTKHIDSTDEQSQGTVHHLEWLPLSDNGTGFVLWAHMLCLAGVREFTNLQGNHNWLWVGRDNMR